MFNLTLMKQGIKSNYKILLIFMAVLTMYISMITSMFDPGLGSALESFSKSMPELMAMFGMSTTSTTLIGFLSTYLYGFILLIFPMVFTIIISNRLITRHIDKGSMAYLLASPNKRSTIVITQIKVLVISLFILILFCTTLGIIISEAMFKGDLDKGKFIILNIGLFCLHYAIGGFCMLVSCAFNESKYSLTIGAGIPTLAYLIQMIANMGGKFQNLKYATFFTLFNPESIINGESSAYMMIGVLFAVGVIFYLSAIYVFCKKDFSL